MAITRAGATQRGIVVAPKYEAARVLDDGVLAPNGVVLQPRTRHLTPHIVAPQPRKLSARRVLTPFFHGTIAGSYSLGHDSHHELARTFIRNRPAVPRAPELQITLTLRRLRELTTKLEGVGAFEA
jgi:hypothetical protein